MIETQCEAAATAFLSAIALNPHAHAMDAEGKKHASANTVKRGRNWGCDPCIPVRWQQQRRVGIETRSRPRQDPRRRGHCVGVERKNHASANTITRQQCHQENALHCGQIEQQAAQSVLLQHVRGGGPQVNGTSSAHTTWRGTSVVVWTGPGSPSKRQLQHRKAGRAFGAIGVK